MDFVPLACEYVDDSTYVMLLKIYTSSDLSILIHGGYSNFGMNMPFILSSEAKNAYFMSGEATNEIYNNSIHEMK